MNSSKIIFVIILSCVHSRPQQDNDGLLNLAFLPLDLFSNVLRAVNDTTPQIVQGIDEIRDFAPLALGLGRAFLETRQEKDQEVLSTFLTSLNCGLKCNSNVSSSQREDCRRKCKDGEADKDVDGIDERSGI